MKISTNGMRTPFATCESRITLSVEPAGVPTEKIVPRLSRHAEGLERAPSAQTGSKDFDVHRQKCLTKRGSEVGGDVQNPRDGGSSDSTHDIPQHNPLVLSDMRPPFIDLTPDF